MRCAHTVYMCVCVGWGVGGGVSSQLQNSMCQKGAQLCDGQPFSRDLT